MRNTLIDILIAFFMFKVDVQMKVARIRSRIAEKRIERDARKCGMIYKG